MLRLDSRHLRGPAGLHMVSMWIQASCDIVAHDERWFFSAFPTLFVARDRDRFEAIRSPPAFVASRQVGSELLCERRSATW